TQEIVITRHGKPAGVLFGFETEDDWFDYRLENDPQFFAANRARATVCGQDVELSWRTLKGINASRSIYTSILAALQLNRINHLDKGKSTKVGISGANFPNTVLSHKNSRMRVMKQIAGKVWKLGNDRCGNIGVPLCWDQNSKPR
ncbi:MAG: hypothetical protein WAU53_11250, partial [Rhodoplanes sp.]